MMTNFKTANIALAATALLAALPSAQAGLYSKNSPVIQLNAKNYDQLIVQSNHTAIVEFYAPWCGHCKNLQPAYEKAAKHLDGIAKVAAIDCDADENKSFCGGMGVQGFPTLKTVRPGKGKGSKPIVEDYNGARTAKGIVDAVSDKINNHVTKITDNDFMKFMAKNDKPKAILFTEKGTTSALLKSVAIDFLDVISVAQARSKEAQVIERFQITKFPTLLLLDPESSEPMIYNGEMKKGPITKFLSQAGAPNPDPPVKAKKAAPKEKKDKESTSSAPETSESSETPAAEKPAEVTPPLTVLETAGLMDKCLNTKAKTCLLAFVPSAHSGATDQVLSVLSGLAHKHSKSQKHHLFPFYEVDIDANRKILDTLEIQGQAAILTVNGKRNWWRQYQGDLSPADVEAWVDTIRLNEGAKHKFPEGVLAEGDAAASSAASASSSSSSSSSSTPEETTTVVLEKVVEEDIVVEPETETEPELAGTIHAQPTAEESGHDEL